ncbi:uncharacterized protein SPSK_04438 [Sporothrix schenckii 1099-18]|uniref:Dolichol-phosphate mannosyltransferase n=2 Tax=Sporothrix schenckii TaxID=29908 RepID=U7PXA5_SPOS1|nr:uncharacterized protein SPSK_04438 [Sporothrix schenckii 1099-18]ERS99090.1 hypothetical protein HMPREF1624_04286 [Sporothrix schenckii ATCC 58251]KJR83250.1 hypothetical protein SPSK_04438 [Sporothrix schenckii 1099-18]
MTAVLENRLKAPFSVIVHPFDSPTRHSCAYELVTANSVGARHALVFIGGLTDGPHTTPYIRTIAHQLATSDAAKDLGYSVFELRMSSSFHGYGFKRLTDDVADLSALVTHLKDNLGRDKIVFLGHSTGCQDQMAYAKAMKAGTSPEVSGFILQGPVSDRECLVPYFKPGEHDMTVAATEGMIKEGKADVIVPPEYMPEMITAPHSAYRWHSLVSFNGDDDFFSSDLPDERLADAWSQFTKPVLVLPSEKDECVPKTIDVPKNVARWKSFCPPGVFSEFSGSIPGASHAVEQPDAQLWVADRVTKFLKSLE